MNYYEVNNDFTEETNTGSLKISTGDAGSNVLW